MRIGFVGSGSMAAAMARGWAGASELEASFSFTDGGSGRAAELAAEVGGEAVSENGILAPAVDLIVLAMKPAQLDAVAGQVAPAGKPIVSLLGATSLGRLGEVFPGPVVRVMPNVGVEVRRGVLCYAFSENVEDDLRSELAGLLAELGTAIELEDRLIDTATAVMGCSPAYMALLCEALIEAGSEAGLAGEEARRMVAETLAGTGELLSGKEPASVRESVTSPGGSTEAGLGALAAGGFSEALGDAVSASLEKMGAAR